MKHIIGGLDPHILLLGSQSESKAAVDLSFIDCFASFYLRALSIFAGVWPIYIFSSYVMSDVWKLGSNSSVSFQ